MRTKVEKRRVRHDPPGDVLNSAGQGDGVNSVSPVVLSSSSVLTGGGERRDTSRDLSDRRPVSLSEAERLAAANHVVVALGPPVVVGSRVLLDSKGDGGVGLNLMTNAAGPGGHHSSPDSAAGPLVAAAAVQEGQKKEESVSPPIKKPPKKRRNNEKKADVVTDLVPTAVTAIHEQFPPSTELQLPPAPAAALLPQLQQPPMTPPTPSPQHPSSLSPPQQTAHLAAQPSRSPNHPPPPPLVPPQQPVAMATATPVDHVETANHRIEGAPPAMRPDTHAAVNMVQYQAEKVPDTEEGVPSLQAPFPQGFPLVQSGLVQTVADTYSGESSLPASTSLLQPPTWLLTPQELPASSDGVSASEHMAASEQTRAEPFGHNNCDLNSLTQASHASVTSPVQPDPSKGSGVTDKSSKKPAKSSTGAGKSKKKKAKSDSGKGTSKSSSSTAESTAPASSGTNSDVTTGDKPSEGESVSADSKPKPKPKKPPKKRPLPLDENVERRIANIEATIDRVIANYVYNCDDLSKLDGLRQAQREAEAKEAEEEAKAKANRAKAAAPSGLTTTRPESTVPVLPPDSKKETVEDGQTDEPTSASRPDGDVKPESEGQVPVSDAQKNLSNGGPESATAKKKPAAKKSKKKTAVAADSCENGPTHGSSETAETPKKKTPKKKKKGDSVPANTEEAAQKVSGGEPDQTDKTQSEGTKENAEDAQPSPPKKKKKASKKKDAALSSEVQSNTADPSSGVIPNGHIESTSADNSPKPAKKKKKSKPKVKKGANDSTKAGDADAGVEKEGMQTGANSGDAAVKADVSAGTGDSVAQSAGTDVPARVEKPAKPKPKKAKKRKADAPAVSEGGENKEAGDERKAEDGDHSKPSPKKKKKKEENSGEATQTKKKKSPSKSKKTKQTQPGGTDGAETANTDSNVQQNGLPHSNDGSIDANTTESKPSEAEIGTSTEGLSENDGSSSLEKKVKKTLEEVSCQECGHKTRGQAALSRHMKKMHEKSISLPYPCNQENCEYSASKVSLLARHMLTHRLYMCSRCQFTVDTKDQYEDHLQVVHNVKLDCKLCKRCNRYIKCDTMPLDKHLETCQGPVPFSCDVCKKEFRYESSLKVHHHSHFPDQPKLFHCSQCDYSSNYRANLHKHVQNMHVQRPKDIKCLTCDKMFSTEDNMRRHMKIHTQVRPHKCDKCDKAFKSACALKGHAVCHELARPYQCNIDNCNREFRTPKFLKSHQEEFHRLIPKKYHCPVEGCSFSFFKLSHLKRHEISHTGERNFHCKWPGCGKSFRHSDNLKVHLRQHTDERPISCHHCSFTCRQKSSLHWHIKKMHGQSNLSSSPDNSNMDAVSLSSLTNPEPMETTPSISEGAEVVVEGVSGVSVNIVLGEDGEVPVTITEIHPVDLYEFHSDNDSSDEATPGVFKRNKSKMASAAPLPPPPKELLMKNSVLDVLDAENNQVEVTDGKVKPKKKKSPTKKTKTAKQNAEEDAEKKENEAATAGEGEETKTTPEKKPQTETKKKSSASKPKKKKAESKESAAENEEAKDSEPAKETKTPPKTKKAPAKKKTPTKQSPKEASAVAEKPVKTKAPAKGKKSPKTRSSPKKPSSPKGKLAKPATRKTPPRKAAAKKAPAKAPAKKSPAKKTATKKKAPAKKKAPPKKKAAAKKSKEKQEEPEAVVEDKVEESVPERGRSRKKSQTRASKDRRAGVEELASSPARPDSPVESEEENMPQGKGSPYREFDSQHMESSPEPRESPSPPASPTPGDLLQKSPASEDEAPVKESEEVAVPAPVEAPEETEQPDAESSSDGEVINDIPLTPPRAPAPPPPESSDEEEMVPSPPAHMPMSADTSDTAAPSSVLTDVQQPGSQAPDFQQPHSREEFQQPHSREEFQQPLSQQPMSREEYPQIHSREEILQPHSREEYTQPLSREEYTQPHSISQPHSQQEYIQPHSREDYPQLHSREELHQQHSREELQPQGSVPEPVSEPVPSVHSEGMHDDASMPHSVVQYDPATASPVPVSEAESAYQYLQGLAQSADSMPEPLAGEPTRLQQLEALAEKPMEDSRPSDMTVKSPVAAPTSVITSLSPVATNALVMGPADMSSHRRMEILASDRQVEQTIARDTSSVLPRLPDPTYDTYSALNPLAAGATRDNNNLFPAPPGTPSFMRLTESEAMLQRQRMTTPFLPTPQPPDRSLSRLPESSLRAPNPSALLRRPATMAGADMFPATPGMPQAMQRNPFTNTWAGQDVRPAHWGQAPTYLQRPANAPTTPFPFATKDNYLAGREFMFDPTVRPGVTDRNMFASLSTSQASASETNPFPLDRFDLSTYFGSHAYSGASGLDYSRTACGTTPKTFDERYRQTAASMTDFRPLPPTTSTDMFSGIGVGVNSLNSASFNLDKYAMYGRDPMYHAAAQQLSDNTNSAFLTHPAPTQHSVFDRDYAARSLYSQNPAYPFIDERQYSTAAKLTGHTPAATMGQERDFMTRSTANENQMQDPYRCGMLYNVMNRYGFE